MIRAVANQVNKAPGVQKVMCNTETWIQVRTQKRAMGDVLGMKELSKK